MTPGANFWNAGGNLFLYIHDSNRMQQAWRQHVLECTTSSTMLIPVSPDCTNPRIKCQNVFPKNYSLTFCEINVQKSIISNGIFLAKKLCLQKLSVRCQRPGPFIHCFLMSGSHHFYAIYITLKSRMNFVRLKCRTSTSNDSTNIRVRLARPLGEISSTRAIGSSICYR